MADILIEFAALQEARQAVVDAAGTLRTVLGQWAAQHDIEEDFGDLSISELVKLVTYYAAIRGSN